MRINLSTRNCRLIIAIFTALLGISYIALDRMAPAGRRLVKVGGVDTVLYFDTAHSILFDHDFNLNNEFARIRPDAPRKIMPVSGLPSSCYAIGYSLLEVPFLALGTVVDAGTGRPDDGYSGYALYFYCLANIVFTGLGLLYLFKLLCEAAPSLGIGSERAPATALFVTFATFFGTTVGFYSFTHLAHTATFLLSAAFMYYWWKIRSSSEFPKWLLLGVTGGFLSICRWQDAIFLGAPVLFDLMTGEPWRNTRLWIRSRSAFAAGVTLCWIPQFLEWKAIYGKYLIYPYSPSYFVDNSYEIGLMKFSFPPPFLWRVLTSSRSGWFLWTPLVALGVAGLLYGITKSFRLLAPWVAVVGIELFLVGSVNGWHGTDSFGSRLMMSTIPVVSLGLFMLLGAAPAGLRGILIASALCCCVFSSLFAIQYRLDLLPSGETLTPREIFSDKVHLIRVRSQKKAASRAQQLLAANDAGSAVPILEDAASRGDDRDVLATLVRAYRAKGDLPHAQQAEIRWKRYLDTRLE